MKGDFKMIVYHGSPNKFEKFDYDRIRTNGTSEGVGFYFTNNKEIATGYARGGYLYTVKIHGEKALSDNKKTLTREEVETLLFILNKRSDFLSNYGEVDYEGYGVVMNRALNNEYDDNDTDSDILGSIYNGDGENPDVLHIVYNELGYDHIVSEPTWGKQRLVIALTNDIIEIVDVERIEVEKK